MKKLEKINSGKFESKAIDMSSINGGLRGEPTKFKLTEITYDKWNCPADEETASWTCNCD
ncbi:MAG: hypothetical protein HYR91_10480 [Flavobacteriia bacterium]|nr:hypothetical protein [Flavobacteriia bacterium]